MWTPHKRVEEPVEAYQARKAFDMTPALKHNGCMKQAPMETWKSLMILVVHLQNTL